MNKILFLLFTSVSGFAWDSTPGDFNGKYIVTGTEVCVSYSILFKCTEMDDFNGKSLEIIQSRLNEKSEVCIKKSFKDSVKYDSCYQQNPQEHSYLSLSGDGFKGEVTEYQLGKKFVTYYAKLSRSGLEYTLKDGGSTKGIHIYSIYTLQKSE